MAGSQLYISLRFRAEGYYGVCFTPLYRASEDLKSIKMKSLLYPEKLSSLNASSVINLGVEYTGRRREVEP